MTTNQQQVRVSVCKETPDDRVGVSFRLQDSEDDLVIQAISNSSLFANTDLKVGMVVRSVNGINAEFLSLTLAMGLLREAEDVVTIVAEGPTPDTSAPATIAPATIAPVPARPAMPTDPSLIVVAVEDVEAADDSQLFDACPVVECLEVTASPVTSASSVATPQQDTYRIITVTATKPTPNSLTGLGLKDHPTAGTLINRITPYSIFHGSALRPGLKMLSINDTDCQFLRKEAVAAALRNCAGSITVRAAEVDLDVAVASTPHGIVTATVVKARQETKVGLGVRTKTFLTNNRVVPIISNINPNGLFAGTQLRVGMRVLSVNSVSCRGRDDCVAMLRVLPNQITVVAGPEDVISATVTKDTPQTRVGLNMTKRDGLLVARPPTPGGLFSKTDLREGMQILQINGVLVGSLPCNAVAALIAAAECTVTVLAKEAPTDSWQG